MLPFQFYAILTLSAVLFFVISGRDFGPMGRAQQRFLSLDKATAEERIEVVDDGAGPPRLSLFIVPLSILLGLIGVLLTWYAVNDELTSIHVRSTMTIAYAAASIACAYLMFKHQKVAMNDSLNTFIRGAESMVFVVIILILAWSLSSVIKDLGTAQVLSTLVGGNVSPALLPAIVFVLGAIISIATGSSWGTFAILMTLAIPVAVAVDAPLYMTIGAVLSGGLFGDHTSPISDTTVLASIGADCAHIDHVSTQFYYAMVTGGVAFATFLIAGIYDSPWLILLAMAVLFVTIQLLCKRFGTSIVDTESRATY